MKKFQHINFIVSTVCECRLELLNLHDLFPCGKAGRGGGGGWGAPPPPPPPPPPRVEASTGKPCEGSRLSMDLVLER